MNNELVMLMKPILSTIVYVFGKEKPEDAKWDVCFVFDEMTHPNIFKYLIENLRVHIVITSKAGRLLSSKPVGLTSYEIEGNRAYMTISTKVMLGEKSVSAKNKAVIGDKVTFELTGARLYYELEIEKERA